MQEGNAMFSINKLPFLISIMLATITALSGLYNGKSFDIMAKETCIVIVSSYAFGILVKYALITLIKDVIKKNIEDEKIRECLDYFGYESYNDEEEAFDDFKEKIEDFLGRIGVASPCYYTKNNSISDTLNKEESSYLNEIIKRHKIEAVIIATEPLAHFKYAKWALDSNLHILLDKPISTGVDVSTSVNKANKLFKDYTKLAELYIEKNKKQQQQQ